MKFGVLNYFVLKTNEYDWNKARQDKAEIAWYLWVVFRFRASIKHISLSMHYFAISFRIKFVGKIHVASYREALA